MNRITDVLEAKNNGLVIIEVEDINGEKHYFEVKNEDLTKYENGAFVQDAFPYLTTGEREILISGITPQMWDEMFGVMDLHDDESEEDGWMLAN